MNNPIKKLRICVSSYTNHTTKSECNQLFESSRCLIRFNEDDVEFYRNDETPTNMEVYQSSFKSKENAYFNECNYLIESLVDYLPNYIGNSSIEIFIGSTNLFKTFEKTILRLHTYLHSKQGKAVYRELTIQDFIYDMYDEAIIRSNTIFYTILKPHLEKLLHCLYQKPNLKLDVSLYSSYNYRFFHHITDENITDTIIKTGKLSGLELETLQNKFYHCAINSNENVSRVFSKVNNHMENSIESSYANQNEKIKNKTQKSNIKKPLGIFDVYDDFITKCEKLKNDSKHNELLELLTVTIPLIGNDITPRKDFETIITEFHNIAQLE